MKRWCVFIFVLVLLLSLCAMGAAAAETDTHTIAVKVLGKGDVIPGETVLVPDGGDVTLWFMPDEGYELVGVYVDGFAVTYALPLYGHRQDCEGCTECEWINWSMAYAGIEDDDWDNWETCVTLRNVCADHLIYVDFDPIEQTVEQEAEKEISFTDLTPGAWYTEAVDFAVERGLMNGVGDGRFDPNGITTRAQLVTILWRMESQPAVKYDAKFADVAADSWYTDAVCWAAAEGIVNGSGGKFAPHDPITREQLASILWRYAKYKGMDVSVGENTNILSYNDAFDVTGYAYPALQWTCGAGIMNGTDGYLQPQGQATRAQTAAILYRYLSN